MPNMIRKSRALGLILAAMLTMGVAASSAFAAEFHSEAEHTLLDATATSVQKFAVGEEAPVECTAAGTKFEAETLAVKTTKEVTTKVAVATGTCTVSGFPVHVDFTTGECDYLFTSDGTVHLKCKAGGSVTLTPTFFGSVCTIHVYPGTYSGVGYSSGTSDVKVHATVTGISANVTGGGGLCGPEGATTSGTYEGDATVSGTNTTGGAVKVWYE